MIVWEKCEFRISSHFISNFFPFSVENNIFTIDYLSTIASIPKTDEIPEDMETSSPSGTKRKKSNHMSTSISDE
jgi:hypothetical protein